MAGAYINGPMAMSMKVIGLTMPCVGKVFINGQMTRYMREIGPTAFDQVGAK